MSSGSIKYQHTQGIPKPCAWTKVDFEGGCNDEDDPLRPQGGCRVININANSASLGCQLSLFQSTKYTTTAAARHTYNGILVVELHSSLLML